jgi:hypothetical protein
MWQGSARTGADKNENEDEAVALQREAAAVQAAVPVAWAVQEHCTGPEALALGVLIRAIEDALAGSLWASLTPAGDCGRPHSQMERAAQEAAIACMAHADAGLLTIKLSMAKNKISETYGINIGTVHKWWRDAKASGVIYDVPLTSFEGLTAAQMDERRRERTEEFEILLRQLASFVRK